MRYRHRAYPRNKLLQKLIGMHEHGKVATTNDRHKRLVRSLDGLLVLLSERRRRRKVLHSLEDKHRDRKFKTQILRPHRRTLADKTLAAQLLASNGIVDVLDGIAGRYEHEAKCPK